LDDFFRFFWISASEVMSKNEERVDAEQASVVWQKLCAVSQRLLLARAVETKVLGSQLGYPDANKHKLLKSLSEEMVVLNFVKSQLEEAVTRFFSQEISLNSEAGIDGSVMSCAVRIPSTETMTFPLTHLSTPIMPSTGSDQPSQSSSHNDDPKNQMS
jgi:hypothetical protein